MQNGERRNRTVHLFFIFWRLPFSIWRQSYFCCLQHKYKKHKKNHPNPKSPLMKQPVSYLTGMEKLDSPKSVYLSDDQASCSSHTNSMSAPPSPHPESFSSSINILKAVLTGSQEVGSDLYNSEDCKISKCRFFHNIATMIVRSRRNNMTIVWD